LHNQKGPYLLIKLILQQLLKQHHSKLKTSQEQRHRPRYSQRLQLLLHSKQLKLLKNSLKRTKRIAKCNDVESAQIN